MDALIYHEATQYGVKRCELLYLLMLVLSWVPLSVGSTPVSEFHEVSPPAMSYSRRKFVVCNRSVVLPQLNIWKSLAFDFTSHQEKELVICVCKLYSNSEQTLDICLVILTIMCKKNVECVQLV